MESIGARLSQTLYDKCATGNGPAVHSPCIVLVAHPLLSATAISRALVNGSDGVFVQSAGSSSTAHPAPLVDVLFEHLLCQAGMLRLAQSQPGLVHAADSQAIAEQYWSLVPVAQQRVLESVAGRIEQLAARAAITDTGIQVTDVHTYLALCTRNSSEMVRYVRDAHVDLEAQQLDTQPADAEYSREWYDRNLGTDIRVQVTLDMEVTPALEGHRALLEGKRFWTIGALPQIEVLVGDPCLDRALLDVAGAKPSVALTSLQRTEALQRTNLYDDRNTLYLVLAPSADYLRLVFGCIHQWLATQYADMSIEMRCMIMTRLSATVTSTWDLALSRLPVGKHGLVIRLNDTPVCAQHTSGIPSRYLDTSMICELVCSAALHRINDMVNRNPILPAGWTPVNNTHGQLQSRIEVAPARPLECVVEIADLRTDSELREDVPMAFRRLFGVDYIKGEFYWEIEARPADRAPEIDRSEYTALLEAESVSDKSS